MNPLFAIFGVVYLIFLPWIRLAESLAGKLRPNGHGAGVGEGFTDIAAIIIGIIEVIVALVVTIIILL